MEQGFTLWLTGLTGSGKTTLARMLEEKLLERGLLVELLDGEEVRDTISPELGFTTNDRELHLRRIAYISSLLNRNGVSSIVAAVSPSRTMRDTARGQLPVFLEAYLDCPLEVCKQRDFRGLYARAEKGEITDLAGVDFSYEPPEKPEIVLHTDKQTPDEGATLVIRTLEIMELIPSSPETEYSDGDEEIIKKRLTDLGYL